MLYLFKDIVGLEVSAAKNNLGASLGLNLASLVRPWGNNPFGASWGKLGTFAVVET